MLHIAICKADNVEWAGIYGSVFHVMKRMELTSEKETLTKYSGWTNHR